MKRRMLRGAAVIGAATVSALAVSPVFAAAATSQASAQSVNLSIAGTDAISQLITATNDGSGEVLSSNDTLPTLASLLPPNNLIGAGVAPQTAHANGDGTSYACAGIAGTGGGIVTVGNSSCNIDGTPLTIDLANLSLGSGDVLLGSSTIVDALPQALVDALNLISAQLLGQVVTAVSDGLASTPLGDISVGGTLSAIEAVCTADPTSATGTAHLVDSSGGSNDTPIGVTLPDGTGGTQNVVLLNLPANPPANTHVLVNLDTVTQTLIDAITVELNTAVGGALSPLGLGALLQQVQDAIVVTLVQNLQPLLQPLQDNLLDITLNKQSTGDNGRSVDVTALDAQVLPAAQQFTGASLISGALGHVTCGPNTAATTTTPTPTPTEPSAPEVPTVVDAGVAGHADHTARNVLIATTGLLLLGGSVGLAGYRRMLVK